MTLSLAGLLFSSGFFVLDHQTILAAAVTTPATTTPEITSTQSITIAPSAIDQVVQPGTTISGSLAVLNQGKSTYSFAINASPYHVTSEDYVPKFSALPGEINVASWFYFAIPTAQLAAGQDVSIPYTIGIPQGTKPGDYYAVVFAETQSPTTLSNNAVVLHKRVGTVFYLTVPGPTTKSGSVLSWGTNLSQQPPLTATLRLANTGSVHLPATIHVSVEDLFGHPKLSYDNVKEIFPQTTRRIPIAWDQAPSFGIFKVSATVNYLNQSQVLSTHYVFVMTPAARNLLVILLVILVTVAVGIIVVLYGKRKGNKNVSSN